MKNKINPLEKEILERLTSNGYDAMVVGGAVRDFLLGNEFNDIDIATNAPYDVLVALMDGLAEIKFAGSLFGVLLVGGIEVATYRSEVCKDNVVLELDTVPSAFGDSKRRDFTINTIYYDYSLDVFHDFHCGTYDLNSGIIRAVGNPYERFNEDYSRILRALYLSASLGFSIEEDTGNAIRELGYCIKLIPTALQGKIIKKVIRAGSFYKFLRLLEEYGLLEHLFPEMAHTVGLRQNSMYHKHDVWKHTLEVVKSAESVHEGNVAFVMGAFLHDVAKGLDGVRATNRLGKPSDLGHEDVGVPIAKKICRRLELGKDVTNEVAMYVKWHGARMATTKKSVKHFLFKFKDSFSNAIELYNKFNRLLDFMMCDADGFNVEFGNNMIESLRAIRLISDEVFHDQVFYSSQFNFSASVIAQHPNVKTSEIREWIEFFIKNNIIEQDSVIKILDKQVLIE